MIDIDKQSDRDLLVQLLLNQEKIERKIDLFLLEIEVIRSRVERLENDVDRILKLVSV